MALLTNNRLKIILIKRLAINALFLMLDMDELIFFHELVLVGSC